MANIALVGALGREENLDEFINEVRSKINKKGKIVLWWSYPIKHCTEEYENKLPFWFYLYKEGKLVARYRVVNFETREGNEGFECPSKWEIYLPEDSWKGKKRLSEKKSDTFKTWFLVDKVEKLENPIDLNYLKSFCSQDINTSRLNNSFIYIYEPLFSKDDLKSLIRNFVQESIEKRTLKTKHYKSYYKNLEIEVGFGQGQQAKVSWMAFLRTGQTVSKGIYPVLLFNRKNCLVLAFGVSETQKPDLTWPSNTKNNYSKIKDATCPNCDISLIQEKYPKSYLKNCYNLENGQLSEEQFDKLIEDLDEVIDIYKGIFVDVKDRTSEYSKEINKTYCFESLKLDKTIVNSFYNSLKTKGFVILAGLSGTGKTKIFEEFVKCFPLSEKKIERWLVFKNTDERIIPIKKHEINFKDGKIYLDTFIKAINKTLGVKTSGKIVLKLGDYYVELIPVIERLKEKSNLIEAYSINNHLATYIACIFGFEVIEKSDVEKLKLKELKKEIEIKEFSKKYSNYILFPIRPDFRDSKALLGFYNPLKDYYHSTPLLELIIEATKNYVEKGTEADPFFILFDEMNLARVEYYFADFLSILEAKRFERKEDALDNYLFMEFLDTLGIKDKINDKNFRFTSQGIKLHNENIDNIPKELFLPPNLYFVGTVNIDETTYMFSPKVLDRAFTIEFNVGSFEDYLKFFEQIDTNQENFISVEKLKKDFTNNGDFAIIDTKKIKEFFYKDENKKYLDKLERINQILKKYNLHFGYRVFNEIIMFLYNSQNSIFKFENLNEAFDLAVKMKVLPKFHGTRQRLEKPIKELIKELCNFNSKDKNEDFEEKIEKSIKEGIPNLKDVEEIIKEFKVLNNLQRNIPKYTIQKLLEMLYKVKSQGFTSFI